MPPELEEHRTYLRDRHRLSAFRRALDEVVRPGSVVVDLASGTGILGMFACRAGASRVYAIEQGGIAGVAREIARANGFADAITVVRGNSRNVTLPERADVVVCDQIGGFGLDAGIVEVAREARQTLLRPGGVLVPSAIELCVGGVEHARLHERVAFWRRRPSGLDYAAAAEIAANTPVPVRLTPAHLLTAPPFGGPTIDLAADKVWPVELVSSMRAAREGILHGVAGWFVARLSPAVVMTNSPLSSDRIRRRQLFLPIARAVPVAAGAAIDVKLRIISEDVFSWDVTVAARNGESQTFRHSTLAGLLLAKEDLIRAAPQHRPFLSPGGAARLTVLRLCDGTRTLEEIERCVCREHADVFASPAEASSFVAEVLRQDGRV